MGKRQSLGIVDTVADQLPSGRILSSIRPIGGGRRNPELVALFGRIDSVRERHRIPVSSERDRVLDRGNRQGGENTEQDGSYEHFDQCVTVIRRQKRSTEGHRFKRLQKVAMGLCEAAKAGLRLRSPAFVLPTDFKALRQQFLRTLEAH